MNNIYPKSKYSDLIVRVNDNSVAGRIYKWNGRDEIDQNYHQIVSIKKDPCYLALTWKKHLGDKAIKIGTFKLMTEKLLKGGFIRYESDKDRDHYRIRFVRENKTIYLKTNTGEAKIAVGEFVESQNNVVYRDKKKHSVILNENEIIDIVCQYLENKKDYNIKQKLKTTEKGIDIIAENDKNGRTLWIEAKGGTSSVKKSKRYGKPYTKTQVFDRVAKGVFTGLQLLMNRKDRKNIEVGLAFPDTKYFQEYLKPIKPILKQLNIKMFLVNEDRTVLTI